MNEHLTAGGKIAVCISTYKAPQHIELLLQSIDWYTYLDRSRWDVFICDDGSPNHIYDEVLKIAGKYPWVKVIARHDENRGIPSTWNSVVEMARAEGGYDKIALLNDDLLVVPNWLITCAHFLEANKDNPQLGTMFWSPKNRFNIDAMRGILPTLATNSYSLEDNVSGKEPGFYGEQPLMNARDGLNQGLGRVMCPCGCCFGFRLDQYDMVGGFEAALTSFHEESHFGTQLAHAGRVSIGIPYPRPYHVHGAAFAANPELQAGDRMRASRAWYKEFWNVDPDVPDSEYFNIVNARLMPKIPTADWTWLRPDYETTMQIQTYGGTHVVSPTLVEVTTHG